MPIDLSGPQAIAESVLFGGVDACTIHRKGAQVTFNETTGLYTLDPGALVYSGACALRDQSSATLGGQGQQGMVSATLARWLLKIPLGAPAVNVGDVATMTASRDATLVGQRYVVRIAGGGSFRLSRHLGVEKWNPGDNQDWRAP